MTTASDNTNVLTYPLNWTANLLAWSYRGGMRFGVASYSQDYKNYVNIVEKVDGQLVKRGSWEHCYPPTKIMFAPPKAASDLIITTADYMRLWEVTPLNSGDVPKTDSDTVDCKVETKKVFDGGKPNDFCSPITSFDWNIEDPKTVGCCSIDTTVTIWDIEKATVTTQLIAHDKEVFDIAFGQGTHTFVTCGADGSARLFDLREMEHCTVLYDTPNQSPLLRVAWNKLEQTYLATFASDGTEVVVLDIRFPSVPVGVLKDAHTQPINSINWAPHSSTHLASAGEDCTANIWDLNDLPNVSPTCYLNFKADGPINSISWCPSDEQWIAITSGKQASLLHI